MNAAAQQLAFAGSSRLTEIFPAFGARFLTAAGIGQRLVGALQATLPRLTPDQAPQ